MTKLLLPKMLEKKKGLIVNLSSGSSRLNPPMLMCYGATKVQLHRSYSCTANISNTSATHTNADGLYSYIYAAGTGKLCQGSYQCI